MTIDETYRQAMRFHQAGGLDESEKMLRQVLASRPNHAGALHHLGLLENQKGRADAAVDLIRKAIAADPRIADFQINLGLILSALGRFEEAAASYRQAISLEADSAEAHFHLATALSHLNRFDEAVQIYRKAMALKPNYVDCLINLAIALGELGKLEEAMEAGRKVVELRPDFAQGHYNLGNTYAGLKRGEEALASFREAMRLEPAFAEAHNGMGALLIDMGQPEEAEASIRQALEYRADFADAINNLGNAQLARGNAAEAFATYGRARKLQPDNPLVWCNAGSALKEMGQIDRAIAAYRHALELKPDDAKSINGLGLVLGVAGEHEAAVDAFRRAIAIDPAYAEAVINLGNTLNMLNRHSEAIDALKQAIKINPKNATAFNSLAIGLMSMGELEEGLENYHHALELAPRDALLHCNLVFGINYLHGNDGAVALAEAQRWDALHTARLRKNLLPLTNSRDPDRKVRVGYASNDFREHSVSRFLQPLFQNHDHEKYEIFCYSDVRSTDSVTALLRGWADQWHNVIGKSDESVAEMIRGHGIDILVDLMGHTARNRLRVFARKPAPIQITYLGHPGTTGLATMDYRLTDILSDPPGKTDAFYSEKLLRLPTTNWCFVPPENLPEVGASPVSQGRPVCFGSFNKIAKITSMVLDLWAEILKSVRGSRMFLKDRALTDPMTREKIRREFEQRGVDPGRLELSNFEIDLPSHFQRYSEVDVALDTFPYNGTTTTCEALWMGVPVVTLAGATHVARVGVSLLTNVGLADLIAASVQDYVSIAIGLARDQERLGKLRGTLRQQMLDSSLMNGPQFARDVEAAYRGAWRRWCGES